MFPTYSSAPGCFLMINSTPCPALHLEGAGFSVSGQQACMTPNYPCRFSILPANAFLAGGFDAVVDTDGILNKMCASRVRLARARTASWRVLSCLPCATVLTHNPPVVPFSSQPAPGKLMILTEHEAPKASFNRDPRRMANRYDADHMKDTVSRGANRQQTLLLFLVSKRVLFHSWSANCRVLAATTLSPNMF